MQARDRWAESQLRKEGSAGAGKLQTTTGGVAPGASRRGHAAPPRIRTGHRATGGRHAVAVRTAVGAEPTGARVGGGSKADSPDQISDVPFLALRSACFAAGVGGPSVEKDVRRRAAGRPGTSRQTEGRRVGPGAWLRGEAHPAWTWTAGSVHCRMPSARSCCTPSRARTRRFCRSSRSGCSEPRSYSRGRSQWRAYLSRVRWWICRRRSRGGGSGDSWSRCLPSGCRRTGRGVTPAWRRTRSRSPGHRRPLSHCRWRSGTRIALPILDPTALECRRMSWAT
mmetsp:Transcript_24157/g.77964  ORF Transcript_24157/g.77964 Transcript_24157/m.77964 type:complete len:282 (-) Transcript_24157:311-1156(-)